MMLPRVLLLCGGASGEHDVSLASAASVLAHGEDVATWIPRVIDRTGRLLDAATSRARLEHAHSGVPSGEVPVASGPASPSTATLLHGLVAMNLASIDLVFPLLHGPNGEDGRVQGVLDLLGLPYVGSGVHASALAMDKITMKRVFHATDLPQVAWRPVDAAAYQRDPSSVLRDLEALPWPRFVKPANLGSSVGISRATDAASLERALETAFQHDRRVLVEAAAEGAREIEIGLLGTIDPLVSVAGEIHVGGDGFYDYERKYHDDAVRLSVPAALTPGAQAELQALATRAYAAVDAADLARIDAFLLPDGSWRINEINTMPGFTARSMYPRLLAASGVSYRDLLARLVEQARARASRRA